MVFQKNSKNTIFVKNLPKLTKINEFVNFTIFALAGVEKMCVRRKFKSCIACNQLFFSLAKAFG